MNIHEEIGINSRLDSIQATLLNIKLKFLNKLNNKRRKIAKFYTKNINNEKINIITYSKFAVYHQFVILVKNRDNLIKYLKKNSIQYGIHYPLSINKLKCFKNIFRNKKFSNAEYISSHCLSLPIDPYLTKKDQKKICSVLNNF